MSKVTGIEWTDSTQNFWTGCLKVSEGCKFCYMYRDKVRYGQDPREVKRTAPATFNAPLHWPKTPARVFTCSWSDFFIEEADAWRDDAWDIIRRTPHLTYQILTKRPENIASRLPHDWGKDGWPNVWLGVSGEDQKRLDERMPILLATPASLRFLSYEPALGPIDLRQYIKQGLLGWVITGGESGNAGKYRPMEIEWMRSAQAQCSAYDVPVFNKQLGTHQAKLLKLKNMKGGDWTEWPSNLKDLQVREFPRFPTEADSLAAGAVTSTTP